MSTSTGETATFHVTKNGPKKCSAKNVSKCPYARLGGEHFDTMSQAREFYERTMEAETASSSVIAKKTDDVVNVDAMTVDDLCQYVDKSASHYKSVENAVSARCNETRKMYERLQLFNPYDHADNGITRSAYKSLTEAYNTYRDNTAHAVQALVSSRFFVPAYHDLEDDSHVGNAVVTTSYEPNTKQWLMARTNTMGGSDVGALVQWDFTPESERTFYMRRSYENVMKSKMEPPSEEEIARKINMQGFSGPLYRGTVWEDRIRHDFSQQFPGTVYNAKGQYVNPEKNWVALNFDGITSSTPGGKPDGIVEFKTGGQPQKWDDGVPLNYRGQVLYYLHHTGFEKATVRVLLNDHETRDFTLHRDDDIAPGVNMGDYMDSRVEPFFRECVSKR